jgi:hypothetical protein
MRVPIQKKKNKVKQKLKTFLTSLKSKSNLWYDAIKYLTTNNVVCYTWARAVYPTL